MMPPTMLVPHHDPTCPTQTSPELRRMDMFNRARREELDAMIHSVNPRQGVTSVRSRQDNNETSPFARLFNGLRNGIGNALVNAGQRIQNPA